MKDIQSHPIWSQTTPYNTKINPFKKPAHLLRIFLARQYVRFFPKEMFIGITGSVGKTSAVMACKAVLSQKFKTVATSQNLDPVLNIPITLLQVRPDTKKVILEMGIEYPGEMDFYLSLLKPQTVILTRIFFAHSEFLGGIDQIAREKGKLLEGLSEKGVAILNWDDPVVRKLSESTSAQVFYYGQDEQYCHVWMGNIKFLNFQTSFELNYGVERVEIKTPFLGIHQLYPLLAAATLGINEGISLTAIKKALEGIEPIEHRFQPLKGLNDAIIIDDTYNSSPAAMEDALDTLNRIPARRRIVVLGEMQELGSFSEKLHRQVAQKIYKDKIDLVFLGGGQAQIIADELNKLGFIPERLHSNLTNPQIISKLFRVINKGDIVLIKGSRSVRLDEIVKRVSKHKKI